MCVSMCVCASVWVTYVTFFHSLIYSFISGSATTFYDTPFGLRKESDRICALLRKINVDRWWWKKQIVCIYHWFKRNGEIRDFISGEWVRVRESEKEIDKNQFVFWFRHFNSYYFIVFNGGSTLSKHTFSGDSEIDILLIEYFFFHLKKHVLMRLINIIYM